MALPPGTRIGSYEVLALIGAGGMGEVYRATDKRLDRSVAIKVLPAALAADPVFRARFAREAKTISSLDHPHICALHDVGESDGTAYLVMQYLEGETLAARLARGALPLDEALRRACDIASALDHAHRHQVVHRDLKPGNVMLTKSGARLLDFGLAKPLAALTDAHSTHLDVPVTSAGTVVGTVQYMAPEQIEGREADARTDIFAFGAVLHEMLTGARAFNAPSQASLMSAILRDDPPAPSTLTTGIPPALDHVVKRCLSKDPEERWASAHDLLIELGWIREGGSAGATTQATAIAPRTGRGNRLAWGLAAVSLATAAAFAAWAVVGRETAVRSPSRFVVAPPAGVAWDAYNPPSLSPDGRYLAVVGIEENGARALWLRRLDDVSWRRVEGTSGFTGAGAASNIPGAPFWSPDGRLLLFVQGQQLKRVAVGGSPEVVCTIPNGRDFSAGSVNADGVVLLGYVNGPIDRVALGGGTPTPLGPLDAARAEFGQLTPSFLPDGTSFLYMSSSKEFPAMLGSLTSSERTEVFPRAYGPTYVHPGLLLFYRNNVTMLHRFDLSRRQPEGDAQPLEPQLPPDTFAVSANGTLAYLTYRTGSTKVRQGEITGSNTRLAWYDRSGRELEALTQLGGYMCPRLSPDERFVAVEKFDRDHKGEIWTVDTRRGIETRLTVNPSRDSDAVWSPRGDRIAWARNAPESQLLVQAADGRSAPTVVERPRPTPGGVFTADWSPDGRYLAVFRFSSFTMVHIEFVALDGSQAVQWPSTTFSEPGARFSPDGRWIAYVSEETGTPEVYVRPFPPTSEKVRVSTAGGYQPDWRRDGGELFYVTPDRVLTSVTVRAADGLLEFGKPMPLFRAPIAAPSWGRNHYQPSANGQRFLINVLKPNELKDSPELVVVLDWAQSKYNELRGDKP